jgi:hypothetical protein
MTTTRNGTKTVGASKLCILLVMGAALGCGGGSAGVDGGSSLDLASEADAPMPREAGGGEVAAASPFCTDKAALASVTDLTGTWVARIAGAQVVTAPIVGVMHNQTVLYLLLTITQQGATVMADGRYCDRIQVNGPGSLAPISIPDAWAHTETPVHRPGSFAVGPEGYPVLRFSAVTEVIGAILAQPGDPLPTALTDPRVIDEDHDLNPGITIVLSGQALAGSIYAVQAQTTAIDAVAVAPNRLQGALTFSTAQNVLASNPPALAILYSQGSSGADPVVCNSSFAMIRVADAAAVDGGIAMDGGGMDGGSLGGLLDGGATGAISCEWVRANEATLFP